MRSLIASLILPPFFPLLLGLVGLILLKGRPTIAKLLVSLSLLLQFFLAMPPLSYELIHSLEQDPALQPEKLPKDVGAIVILGAGIDRFAPEYAGASLEGKALERLSYGVYLARQSQLPILLTGGNSTNPETQEASVMKKILEGLFQVSAKWIEGQSANTHENAVNSFKILGPENITKIVLVTHAWHMPRAKRAFEKAGFTVVAASTGFAHHSRFFVWSHFIPTIEAYEKSYLALREYLGQMFYRITYE